MAEQKVPTEVFEALVTRTFEEVVKEVRELFFTARDALVRDVRNGDTAANNDPFVFALRSTRTARTEPELHEYALDALHDLFCSCGKKCYQESQPTTAALCALLVLVSKRLCEALPNGKLAKGVHFEPSDPRDN